ncbi:TIGR02594 family protein [Aeromonas caviae]
MMEMSWIEEARKHIGLTEIKGPKHNPEIVAMWKAIKRGGIKDDETPWCAAFVGACLERVGIVSTRFEGARSYVSWGEKLGKPVFGCVVVFSRDGGGHVGFVVGQDKAGNLLVLGGNQADAVNVKAFPRSRVTAYRWPAGEPKPVGGLPVMAAAEFSKSEA